MKRFRVRRTALLALAMVFLAVAWVWDALIAIGRTLAGFIPWARFKQSFAALVDRLPAPLVLLIFLVPFLIVEPLLVVATVAIAMGYVVSGAIAWIVLKFLAVGLIPAIFDLTKHRLMTMPWFVRAYEKVMAFHHYADQIVAPYKQAAAAVAPPMAPARRRGDKTGSWPCASRRALRRPQAGKRAAGLPSERVGRRDRIAALAGRTACRAEKSGPARVDRPSRQDHIHLARGASQTGLRRREAEPFEPDPGHAGEGT